MVVVVHTYYVRCSPGGNDDMEIVEGPLWVCFRQAEDLAGGREYFYSFLVYTILSECQ